MREFTPLSGLKRDILESLSALDFAHRRRALGTARGVVAGTLQSMRVWSGHVEITCRVSITFPDLHKRLS